ncbi:MAG: hypothetical protein JF599_06945 [Verrucomicrobia bacterium]|nr:hypothetical protein [Verrucomicrobiota bacterium]
MKLSASGIRPQPFHGPHPVPVGGVGRTFTFGLLLSIVAAWLSLFATPGRAQELTFLAGTMGKGDFDETSYSWQVDYRQDIYRNLAASVAYLNEGHVLDHHRDGTAWELWGNLPFCNDRIALSLGGGVYYFYDTQPFGAGTQNVHGAAPIFSFSATGYFTDRVFCRLMVNHVAPTNDFHSTTAAVGIGVWFGPHKRPRGPEPSKDPAEPDDYVTEPQLTVFGGQSVVNTFLSEKAIAGAIEYRQGILPHVDGTVSGIYEGDPKIIRRSGAAAQLWAVNAFYDNRISVGVGIGPYVYIDRRDSQASGSNPAAVAPLVSLTFAVRLSEHWLARLVFDRVTSSYNRDSDIFLAGVGYSWR